MHNQEIDLAKSASPKNLLFYPCTGYLHGPILHFPTYCSYMKCRGTPCGCPESLRTPGAIAERQPLL